MSTHHCTDAQLVALLDGLPVDADVAAHVETCDRCRQAVDTLRDASHAAGRALRASGNGEIPLDVYDDDFLEAIGVRAGDPAIVPLRRRESRRGWAAAAVAAAVAALLLAPPVRAWVVEAVQNLFAPTVDTPLDEGPPPVAPGGVSIPSSGPVVRLALSGEPESVSVEAVEPGVDVITLRVDDAAEVIALRDGFDVPDAAGRTVVLLLPISTDSVEVRIDGRLRWAGVVLRSQGVSTQLPIR